MKASKILVTLTEFEAKAREVLKTREAYKNLPCHAAEYDRAETRLIIEPEKMVEFCILARAIFKEIL